MPGSANVLIPRRSRREIISALHTSGSWYAIHWWWNMLVSRVSRMVSRSELAATSSHTCMIDRFPSTVALSHPSIYAFIISPSHRTLSALSLGVGSPSVRRISRNFNISSLLEADFPHKAIAACAGSYKLVQSRYTLKHEGFCP